MIVRVNSLRWLVLLVFAIAFSPSVSSLPAADPWFSWVNLASMAACALLLTRLQKPLSVTLWVWVILAVLVLGGLVLTVWIDRNIERLNTFPPEFRFATAETLANGYRWISLAFVTFCLSSWVALGLPVRQKSGATSEARQGFASAERAVVTAALVVALSLMAASVQAYLGYGVMGTNATHLPFRLDTILFRFRTDVALAILLLCVWVLDRSRHFLLRYVLVGAVIVLGLSDALVRTSRGSVLLFGLGIILLWLASGRFTKTRVVFVVFLIVAAAQLFPAMSRMRSLQLWRGYGAREALTTVAVTSGDQFETALRSFGPRVLERMVTASGVWLAMSHVPEFPSVQQTKAILVDKGMALYFTQDVADTYNPGDFRAPGLVAAPMLLGGAPAVVAFWVLFVSVVHLLWRWISGLLTAPVGHALLARTVLIFSDGSLHLQNVVSLIAVVVLCEWYYRGILFLRPRTTEPVGRFGIARSAGVVER